MSFCGMTMSIMDDNLSAVRTKRRLLSQIRNLLTGARRFPRYYRSDMRLGGNFFGRREVSFWDDRTSWVRMELAETLTGELTVGEVVSMELSLPLAALFR